jgi:hypothetical protein
MVRALAAVPTIDWILVVILQKLPDTCESLGW